MFSVIAKVGSLGTRTQTHIRTNLMLVCPASPSNHIRRCLAPTQHVVQRYHTLERRWQWQYASCWCYRGIINLGTLAVAVSCTFIPAALAWCCAAMRTADRGGMHYSLNLRPHHEVKTNTTQDRVSTSRNRLREMSIEVFFSCYVLSTRTGNPT